MSKIKKATVFLAALAAPFMTVTPAHASVAGCTNSYNSTIFANPNNPVPKISGFVVDATGTVSYVIFDAGATLTLASCTTGAVLSCPDPYPSYWLHDPYNPVPKINGFSIDATGTVLYLLYPAQPQPALNLAECVLL